LSHGLSSFVAHLSNRQVVFGQSVGDAQKTFMIIRHINEGDEAPCRIFILGFFVSPTKKIVGEKKTWEFLWEGCFLAKWNNI